MTNKEFKEFLPSLKKGNKIFHYFNGDLMIYTIDSLIITKTLFQVALKNDKTSVVSLYYDCKPLSKHYHRDAKDVVELINNDIKDAEIQHDSIGAKKWVDKAKRMIAVLEKFYSQ